MICRPVAEASLTERQQLWQQFLDAYGATTTRPAVDAFLRALIGVPG